MNKLLDNYKAEEVFESLYCKESEAIFKRELDKKNVIREQEGKKQELKLLEKRFDGAFEDIRAKLAMHEELLFKAFGYIEAFTKPLDKKNNDEKR